MSPTLTADSDERVGLVGQTGMGKTYLVERLIKGQPRVIVIDSKHRVSWKGYHMTSNPIGALLQDKVIYRPPTGSPPDSFWTEAMKSQHERGGGVIYIDELSVICTANRIPSELGEVLRVGREIGVGVWWSAQEAVAIHNTTMRQAEQLYLFYNQGASDRDKLVRVCGDMAEATSQLKEFQFVVFVRGETYDNQAIEVYRAD
jgi:hypothetical protein